MYRRIWEIRGEGYNRRGEVEEAYEEGYHEGCKKGYEKAMRELEEDGYGMRGGRGGNSGGGNRGGGGYGNRDFDFEDYNERRRRDSRGRYM